MVPRLLQAKCHARGIATVLVQNVKYEVNQPNLAKELLVRNTAIASALHPERSARDAARSLSASMGSGLGLRALDALANSAAVQALGGASLLADIRAALLGSSEELVGLAELCTKVIYRYRYRYR